MTSYGIGIVIGIDSNALIRWLVTLPGETVQTGPARRAVEGQKEPIYVCLPVLAEAVWVLSRLYKFDRTAIATVLDALLGNKDVVMQDAPAVSAALSGFKSGGPGFADHLIGALNRDAGCSTTLTFDKRAAKLDTFSEIT